jgi:hypothetical protein
MPLSDPANASADLGIAAPAVPADQAAAAEKKAELMADPAWVKRKVSGDPEANAEMTKINEVLVGAETAQPAVDASELDHLRSLGLSNEVIKQVETRQPVTQDEYDRASRLKSTLMKDPEFVRKYLDGQYEARQKMALISIVMSSQIRSK